ncbi:DUF6898 family protein [Radicibacter daui]|uniref:DUF6898 family protein n=1 Tax=Radicibacter daui TaxID=3064829 RepID=UPI0040469CC9
MAETLFEMRRVGSYIRCSAIDPETGIEAVVTGPANSPGDSLRLAARRKLEYLLSRHHVQAGAGVPEAGPGGPRNFISPELQALFDRQAAGEKGGATPALPPEAPASGFNGYDRSGRRRG